MYIPKIWFWIWFIIYNIRNKKTVILLLLSILIIFQTEISLHSQPSNLFGMQLKLIWTSFLTKLYRGIVQETMGSSVNTGLCHVELNLLFCQRKWFQDLINFHILYLIYSIHKFLSISDRWVEFWLELRKFSLHREILFILIQLLD